MWQRGSLVVLAVSIFNTGSGITVQLLGVDSLREKKRSIEAVLLEAIADRKLWIWHLFSGVLVV